VPVVPATAFAVGFTLVHNFVWHTRWTWRTGPLGPLAHALRFGRFVAANGVVSVVGNVMVTGVLVYVGRAPVVVAQLVAVGACGMVNFWLSRAVVFRPPRRPQFVQNTAPAPESS
jgi:putative flippase GtrA